MTKNDLAHKAGISVSFLSDLTNGKANPSLKIMATIANALETPLPALLETTDLDRATLDILSQGQPRRSLPDGFQRITGFCRIGGQAGRTTMLSVLTEKV